MEPFQARVHYSNWLPKEILSSSTPFELRGSKLRKSKEHLPFFFDEGVIRNHPDGTTDP